MNLNEEPATINYGCEREVIIGIIILIGIVGTLLGTIVVPPLLF